MVRRSLNLPGRQGTWPVPGQSGQGEKSLVNKTSTSFTTCQDLAVSIGLDPGRVVNELVNTTNFPTICEVSNKVIETPWLRCDLTKANEHVTLQWARAGRLLSR